MSRQELVTTNIRLPKEHWRALKQEALQEEKSVGSLMRELVRNHIGETGGKAKKKRNIMSIWDLPKLAKKTGDSTLASRVDEIAYGED